MITDHCLLRTIHYSQLTTHYPLPTARHLLPTTRYPPPTTHYPLLTTHHSLPTAHYPQLTTHLPTTLPHELPLTSYRSLVTTTRYLTLLLPTPGGPTDGTCCYELLVYCYPLRTYYLQGSDRLHGTPVHGRTSDTLHHAC